MNFPVGRSSHTLSVGNRERTFSVHIPTSLGNVSTTRTADVPVVLAFHGSGSSATGMMTFSGLSDFADEHGFIVVYPNGSGRTKDMLSWNAGSANVWAAKQRVDDVGFVQRLIDHVLMSCGGVDRPVFATGMSNGGLLCYRLAEAIPDRLQAVAPVAISMTSEHPRPMMPMPVVHIQGTDDAIVPFGGGRGRRSLTQTNFLSVDRTIKLWAEVNGCTSIESETLPQRIDDGTSVTRIAHHGGLADVVLYQVHGAGHTWPGQPCPFPFLGKVTQNLSANETIWSFFRSQSIG